MANGRYTTTEPPVTTRSSGGNGKLSSSDSATMREAFASSPLYSGEYGKDEVQAFGTEALQVGTVDDGGYWGFSDPYNRDFVGAPDLNTVQVGGGGLPGSPYTPNTNSPGEGNGSNPSAIPAMSSDRYDSSGNGDTTSPSSTSGVIANETMGTYVKGVKTRTY